MSKKKNKSSDKDLIFQCLKDGNVDTLSLKYHQHDPLLQERLGIAFRATLLETSDKEMRLQTFTDLIELSITCCRRELTSPKLPALLLQDAFDHLGLDEVEPMFKFVERKADVFAEDLFLLACKDELNRLGKSLLETLPSLTFAYLRGRVHLFLSRFVPIEKSSETCYDTENYTKYSDRNFVSSDSNKNEVAVDEHLYLAFWSLQDYFRDPRRCYDEKSWSTFCQNAEDVLIAMKETNAEQCGYNGFEYRPKYLTEPSIFYKQFKDLTHRRYVLVQFLILFDDLSRKQNVKNLTPDHTAWMHEAIRAVENLLKENASDGENFLRKVYKQFEREKAWEVTADTPTKPIPQNNSATTTQTHTKREHIGDILKKAHEQGRYVIDNGEIDRLWNICPDNIEACVKEKWSYRKEVGYFENIFESMDALDDDNAVPPQLEDETVMWKALRLVTRTDPACFEHKKTLDVRKFVAASLKNLREKFCEEDAVEASDNDTFIQFKKAVISKKQFDHLCTTLAPDWQNLAHELDMEEDIAPLLLKYPEPTEACRMLLHFFFECDKDSTLEYFAAVVGIIGRPDLSEYVKKVSEQNDLIMNQVNDTTVID